MIGMFAARAPLSSTMFADMLIPFSHIFDHLFNRAPLTESNWL
jgi:hypothetical protein